MRMLEEQVLRELVELRMMSRYEACVIGGSQQYLICGDTSTIEKASPKFTTKKQSVNVL
jgi:hypothetical protein